MTTLTDREGLLRAVCENPGDDVPRLILADWCEENGEVAFAQFVRDQILCRTGSLDYYLLDENLSEWLPWPAGPVADFGSFDRVGRDDLSVTYPGGCVVTWHHGFVSEIRAPLADLEAHLPAITACQPVTTVRATDREPYHDGVSGRFGWDHANEGGEEDGWIVPIDLINHMPDHNPGGWAWFDSADLAHAALSLALLNTAREKAGLPSLPRP